MKRVKKIITCLMLLILSAQSVHASDLEEHQAVEAMRKVWNIDEGCLTEEADWNLLADALKLSRELENEEMKADLFRMAVVSRRLLKAQDKAREEEEARKKAEEERQKQIENARYYGNCRITHYCGGSCCCGQWASGITASGEPVQSGWTVSNGSLPFGTKVVINGHIYCVTDRGVGGDQFDIYVDSHSEALARGLYYADVYIID